MFLFYLFNFLDDKSSVDSTESNSETSSELSDKEFSDDMNIYNKYHTDIWHFISKHIAPEDIWRFALICRQTAFVTSTAEFWRHQYRKHFNMDKISELPPSLYPANVLNVRKGMRKNVICALFICYEPFINRISIRRRKEVSLIMDSSNLFNKITPHPTLQRLQRNEYLYECIDKSLRRNTRRRHFDYFGCIPYCYVNLYTKPQNETVDINFSNIHDSEEIFDNDQDGGIIALIRTLKEKEQTLIPIVVEEVVAEGNILRRLDIKPTEAKHRASPHDVDVLVTFQKGKQYLCDDFLRTTQIGLFDWWDPMYQRVLVDEF